jgi:hypothetical protein
MNRNILKLFDIVEKNRDALIVHKDKPIVIVLDKNQDLEDYYSSVFMGVLIDVEAPVIYLKSPFYLNDDETDWYKGNFDDFIKLDPDREDHNATPEPVLEFERIHSIYAPKDDATPEQVRDMWLDPQYKKVENPHRASRMMSPEYVESIKKLEEKIKELGKDEE